MNKIYHFKKSFFYLFGIIIIASFYRLWYIGIIPSPSGEEGYWGLYGLSIYNSDTFTPMSPHDPRILSILISIFFRLFGVSFFSIRFLAAIIGILIVYFTYLLAKRMYNEKVAFLSGFFMAIMPYQVMWSRIVHYHISAILMSIIGILLLFISRTSKRKHLILFFSFLFLSLGLQFSPFHILTLMSLIIYLILTKQLLPLIKDKWVWVIVSICFIISFTIIKYDLWEGYLNIKSPESFPHINLHHIISYFKILLGCITGENEYLHFGGYTLKSNFLLLFVNLLFLCWVIASIIFAFYRRTEPDIFLLTNLLTGIIFLPVILYATLKSLWYMPLISQERHLFIFFPFVLILMSNFVVEFPNYYQKHLAKLIINGLFIFAILFHIFSLNIRYFNLFLNNGGVDNGPIRALDGRGFRGFVTSKEMIPPQEQLVKIINADVSSYPKIILTGDYAFYSLRFYLRDTIPVICVSPRSIFRWFDKHYSIKQQSIYIPIWSNNLLPNETYGWPSIDVNKDLVKIIVELPQDRVMCLKTIYKPDNTPLIHLYKIER